MDSTVLSVKITRNAEEWGPKLLDNLKSCMDVSQRPPNMNLLTQ